MSRPIFGFKEIGSLGYLVRHRRRTVFGTDFTGTAENLAGNQERHQVFRQQLEGSAAVQKVVLVVAVAAAFAVAVVLVDDDGLAIGNELVGARATAIQNTLSGFLVAQQVENVRALGGRVFRVRVVYVETRAIVQDFV